MEEATTNGANLAATAQPNAAIATTTANAVHPADAKKQSKASAPKNRKFPDGYDLDFEAGKLKHLIDADDPDPSDPMYARYEVYLERMDKWNAIKETHAAQQGANEGVPTGEAAKITRLGMLVVTEEDTMTLHTADAMRMYLGARPAPGDTDKYPVPGARQAANALRQLFFLTANDNPCADWMLVKVDQYCASIKEKIQQVNKDHRQKIQDMAMMGINYSILKAETPQTVGMGHRTAYGHTFSQIVALFDQLILAVKSCERRDLVSRKQANDSLYDIKRDVRVMFHEIFHSARLLLNPEMVALSRMDFNEKGMDTPAAKRVHAAETLFGKIPNEIFTGNTPPRHSLRKTILTSEEKRLLKELSLKNESDDPVTDAPIPAGMIE